jgi:hypothetical protein
VILAILPKGISRVHQPNNEDAIVGEQFVERHNGSAGYTDRSIPIQFNKLEIVSRMKEGRATQKIIMTNYMRGIMTG